MADVLIDVFLDTLKIIPFLFAAYLLMEYLEHRMSGKMVRYLADAERTGPLVGAVAGIIPQCGFSATAAGFYAGGLISTGTLLAVFLSTSDEMIPVMLGNAVPVTVIIKILAWKVVAAVLTGLLVDRIARGGAGTRPKVRIEELCHDANCSCGKEHQGIIKPALRHTVKTGAFVFAVSLAAGILIFLLGEDTITAFLSGRPFTGIFLTALIGLIPNCAASVMITELFAEGIITAAQLMSGLLVSAGVGLAVLFRNRRHFRENLRFTGILYVSGVLWGIFLSVLHVSF